MRKLFGLLAAVVFVVGISAPASSATLTLTGSTLSLTIGALPPITVAQSPASIGGFVIGAGNGFGQAGSTFNATVALPTQLFTGVSLISSFAATAANGAGTHTAAGGLAGGFGGSAPIQGTAIIGILGGLINLAIPLTKIGGTNGGVVQAGAAALMITVTGSRWTTGMATVTYLTPTITNGTLSTTTSLASTGSDARNASGAGTVTLVTPIRVITNAAGTLPGFAVQVLTFGPVPEPGTLLLIGSGIVGLGLVGRRKLRK